MMEAEKSFLEMINKKIFKIYKNGKIYVLMRTHKDWNGEYKKRSKIKLMDEKTKKGYIRLNANYKKKRVQLFAHRMIWIYFNGEISKGLEINHKNGIKNDNKLSNLELVTKSENVKHSFDVLRRIPMRGEKNSKLKEKQVLEIRKMLEKGLNQEYIAKIFRISRESISAIKNNRNWAWL